MNIIYLDFDDCLNTDFTRRVPAVISGKMYRLDESYLGLDPVAVQLVDKLAKEIDAQVCLTTSWVPFLDCEIYNGFIKSCEILWYYGFDGEILGHTPRKMSSNRSNEIEWDIKNRKPKKYVIIDDKESGESLLRNKKLKDRTIFCNPKTGFTEVDYQKAIKLW